jgi:hypothetical protein
MAKYFDKYLMGLLGAILGGLISRYLLEIPDPYHFGVVGASATLFYGIAKKINPNQ